MSDIQRDHSQAYGEYVARQDQLAPHSIEAEDAVLGSILLNPDALLEVIGFLTPDDYFLVRNAWIYEAMIKLFEAGDPVDHLTVVQHLEQTGKLSEVGGAAYIISLINKTPSALNVEGYGHIVKRMGLRRLLLEWLSRCARLVHSDETDINVIFATINKELSEIGGPLTHVFSPASTLFGDFIDVLAERIRRAEDNNPDIGFTTGLPSLDAVFGGDLREGVYNLLFGPTGVGKTWMLLQICLELMKQCPVVYVTLETTENQLRDRMVSLHSEVPYLFIKTGMVNGKPMDTEMQGRCYASASELSGYPFEIVDYAITPSEIEAHLARATIRYGRPGICIVDTLNQLADSMGKGERYENLTKASAKLLKAVRMTGWGILASAQQGNKLRPRMSAELAQAWAWPTKSSIEGARTITQHVRNMVGIYSPKFIAEETVNPDFEDDSCPTGHVLFLNVKANDNRGDGAGYLLWREGIPKYAEPAPETKQEKSSLEKAKKRVMEKERAGQIPQTQGNKALDSQDK